ncbi:CoA-binding protein [Actinomadura atramentaria]|uniref:CoA-binding protein n=1 Tax=Actinomadura atramentaria TaxID=1990 RepID=UPI00035E3064|nr:CoA-binding protein [Actinomadura atramentaria]
MTESATESATDSAGTRLDPLLRPRAVAVVGSAPGVLRGLAAGGFGGTVLAVNPHAAGEAVHGAACVASPADLPERPDLVVLAVPAASVADAAAACGRRGARAAVVLTSGLSAAQEDALRAACRAWGMVLVGPGSAGVAVPALGLHATVAVRRPAAGDVAVAVRSGGVGGALLGRLARLNIGVASYVATGGATDVRDDLLRRWAADPAVRLGVLDATTPEDLRVLARAAGRGTPVLALAPASAGGGRGPLDGPLGAVRRALFARSGVVVARTLAELVEAAAVLAPGPAPRGRRVAVLAAGAEAGAAAAAACAAAGLAAAPLTAATRRALPPGPVPGAVVAAEPGPAAAVLGRDATVDAVLVVSPAPPPGPAGVPVVAVRPGQVEGVRVTADGVPSYASPARAARALAHAASLHRADEPGTPVEVPPGGPAAARALVGVRPGGARLPRAATLRLLAAYGVVARNAAPGGRGARVRCGTFRDELFGPVVVLAVEGGAVPAAAACPLTGGGAAGLVRAAGLPPVLAGPVAQLARLAADLPEVARLDVDAVVDRAELAIVNARAEVAPVRARG